LKKTNAPREVVSDPKAPYFGLEINDRSLTPGEGARIAATHFDDWLNTSARNRKNQHLELDL
jgi:hypothetical protein